MTQRIYLGRTRGGFAPGEGVYLEKHTWDCDWYWGFGYVGNKNCHFHMDSMIEAPNNHVQDWHDITHHFEKTWITQDQWWILRDLFLSAYALKRAAEVYRHGGHQTSKAAPYQIIDPEQERVINADLGQLLDNIWKYLQKIIP